MPIGRCLQWLRPRLADVNHVVALTLTPYQRHAIHARLRPAGRIRVLKTLGPSRGTKERQAFSAALETGLERRLVDYPMRIDHLVGMIVLAKQGACDQTSWGSAPGNGVRLTLAVHRRSAAHA